ncbi:MAG: outer membrane lipoprotein-sorting protein [Methyloprofundus sp.]|nr:outer membrane lipoprotein-sorting protein [Methyloprofundus sp.]
MKILIKSVISSFIGLSVLQASYAQTPEQKGLEIAQQVERRDSGWQDATVTIKMILRNKQGDESTRDIQQKILEVDEDGDKSLTVFNQPRDIKGTAFLSFSHIVNPDDQWLYMPALKRVKRISSSNKSGPFMGSQYAYEDLASFEVGKFSYKYLRDEMLGATDSFVVENTPLYEYTGYTRQVVWIDKERYIPLQIKYYDRKNDLLKTSHFIDYQQYLGQYWRANTQLMENHQSGKTTELLLTDYQFKTGLTPRNFDKNSLKRMR